MTPQGDHPYEVSDRGLKYYEPALKTDYGHEIAVYESSAAEQPCLWMLVEASRVHNADEGELHVHMTLEQVEALRGLLGAAIQNHYQGAD